MKPHPLPKTVAPLPDELLSGWLSRLAAANYCDDAELLAHIKIDTAHATALDFSVDTATAEKIANAARVDPGVVRSLTFPAMTPREASLTAQMPFQHCLQCSREGLSLRHWRRAWAFDCQVCGTRLMQTLEKPGEERISGKLIDRARRGAGMLECAARSRGRKQLRRAMRAVTFAMSLKTFRGDPSFAVQNPRSEVRLFCLAAISAARSHPLAKAAIVSHSVEDYARVALLRAFEKEPRLLAAVDRIAQRRAGSIGPMAAASRN
ncbi:TniQ family protein [Phaeobacter gallaeciensis]|uniref:TniQ family protein n=1 Tax=Phaeobacter gallaeciensis TaxID=60890 RepID=UPI00237F3B4B|nr:TniQ family protein [Phaeobacter gallaeciensis]MDE4193164.1 TniQ family protein [Phaeobacter gallaeciensis]MDE4201561.1 TniQ family protein [Phaeobacter gallaeciensis]MDE4205661.1 TniQ family protein [Phaeobacter gallaeciensis]MDE4209884.1 TniQ family protein [Phaeobacter gallaeciensis]MDE4218252.1 TniQ family protein [Phaeobacter gallaeciensis]